MYSLSKEEAGILTRDNVKEGDKVDRKFTSGRKSGYFITDKDGNSHLCPIKSTFDEMKLAKAKTDEFKGKPRNEIPRIRAWEDPRPKFYAT
jgi:hypothetical protein